MTTRITGLKPHVFYLWWIHIEVAANLLPLDYSLQAFQHQVISHAVILFSIRNDKVTCWQHIYFWLGEQSVQIVQALLKGCVTEGLDNFGCRCVDIVVIFQGRI